MPPMQRRHQGEDPVRRAPRELVISVDSKRYAKAAKTSAREADEWTIVEM
jgi:hypothetical protein